MRDMFVDGDPAYFIHRCVSALLNIAYPYFHFDDIMQDVGEQWTKLAGMIMHTYVINTAALLNIINGFHASMRGYGRA